VRLKSYGRQRSISFERRETRPVNEELTACSTSRAFFCLFLVANRKMAMLLYPQVSLQSLVDWLKAATFLRGLFVLARIFRFSLLIFSIHSLCLWAQLTVSTLRGTATDQSGAVVVGAKIRAVNLETNLTREVVTNENGDFEIVDLPRGDYRLTATGAGFKTF